MITNTKSLFIALTYQWLITKDLSRSF